VDWINQTGWNPLNRNLLLQKEICANSSTGETSESTNGNENDATFSKAQKSRNSGTQLATYTFINNLPSILKSSTDVSGVTIDKLIQHVLAKVEIKNKGNLARDESIQEICLNAKHLTSSVMVKQSMHEVNNPTVSTLVKENCD
jgi:hypothetical protein